MTQVEAARVFGVTRQAVGRWLGAWREDGAKALRAGHRGRPRGGQLTPEQVSWARRQVITRTPDQLRLPFFLWTREAVGDLLESELGISLSVWTVGRYLKDWGFTPQKPIRRAFEQNPREVRKWLEERYPAIRAQAQEEKAQIYWGDEMGMRSDHAAGRSWGLKGRTPVIPVSGQRFGCNMISAISNRGRLYFMIFPKEFNGPVFLKFLDRLVRQVRRKVFLILDGHSVHRSDLAKAWLKRNEKRLRLFFLPSYSPELNPDELLNQDVKSNAVGRRPPDDVDDLMANVRGYMHSTQRRPDIVRSYFRGTHVAYAAL